ncbi:hypothetical protein [Streptomyces sp. NBC_00572]|uniref:hypothetical protein n=1 Tax=Streptomyces sp. NBC_00572 TaxID=2903664 RepID=UPI002255AC52|nr:hypothetical protein [Streptomyces sp. NBC_00572]MCX4984105.1 hypothetical protein [Streptomyces sp. NBC_00572]
MGGEVGGIHRFVVFGDICGSGTLDLAEKKHQRAAMYAAFDDAYSSVGVEPGTYHQEDRGDGILAALRPDVPPTLMVGRWIDTLYESLRAHNQGRTRPLRLRIGMNAGLVVQDRHGLVGRAVDLAARLCDSPPAKRIMNETPEIALLVVVSDWLYVNVVAEGGRYVEPDHYRSARIRSKETDEAAWFHVPRRPEPPLIGPDGELPPEGEGEPAAAGERPPVAAARTGVGPSRGDGPTPRPVGGNRTYHVGGDLLDVHGNTIHGGFTGIRKDSGSRTDSGSDSGSGTGTGTGSSSGSSSGSGSGAGESK